MRWMWMVLTTTAGMATEDIFFFDFDLDPQGDQVTIKVHPVSLMSYEVIKDDDYDISRQMVELALDAPIRQTAFLVRTLERNRGTIMGSSANQPLNVLEFEFELTVRKLNGEPIHTREYKSVVGLSPETDTFFVQSPSGERTFSVHDLNRSEPYQAFLSYLALPYESLTLPKPKESRFLVDLYMRWPDVLGDAKDLSLFDLFPSLILWNKGVITRVKVHLGSAYVSMEGDMFQVYSSNTLHFLHDVVRDFGDVLKKLEEKDEDGAIASLEEYLVRVPTDQKAMQTLMNLYLKRGRKSDAYDLINRFEPFFATIREGLSHQKRLAAEAVRKRNQLLGRRSQFNVAPNTKVTITAPQANDLVTGSMFLEFNIENAPAPLLRVDCFADDQLISHLRKPPFRTRFTVLNRGFMSLSVVAYFENETCARDEIRVRCLDVDQEEFVRLVPLRVVVAQGKGQFLTDLSAESFTVEEAGEPREIAHFRKDQSPLRIALLVDTSISMFGEKLLKAQYAVHTFLDKLEPEDRVSLYTFDHKVLRLSDFTNDVDSLKPFVFTLSPQLSTSLYDAILAANDALIGQNGSKVIIIVSDGSDSSSSVTDIHVANLIKRSDVMVYSIILPGGELGDDHSRGNVFLEQLARLSGSISTQVRKVDRLDEVFDRIYQELKSYYYLDFYSDKTDLGDTKLKVDVDRMGSRVRFRRL